MIEHEPPVLTGDRLNKRYGEVVALHDVSLSVRAGESVAIMGASGCGKTTLMHSLAAITKPDAGSVHLRTVDGMLDLTGANDAERSRIRRTHFGFVFQDLLLVPELTASDNVALPLLIDGHSRAQANSAAKELLADLGLAGLEKRRIGQLSGGQAHRVAIARALVTGTAVVFADEPTGSLDSKTSSAVVDSLLEATTNRGRSLVLVTHDRDVASTCDRILHMRDGRIVGQTTDSGAAR